MNKKKKEIKPNQKFIKKDNKKIEVQKNKENNNSKEKNIKESKETKKKNFNFKAFYKKYNIYIFTFILVVAILIVGTLALGFKKTALILLGVLVLAGILKLISKKKGNNKNEKKNSNDVITHKGLKIFLLVCFSIGIIGLIAAGIFAYVVVKTATPKYDPKKLTNQESSIIYDRDGKVFAELASEKREIVSYEELPEVLVNAIIATEDSRFFQHNGFDLLRFTKASIGQVLGRNSGGASTLTMQISKMRFTSTIDSGIEGILRKFQDIYLSVFKIERNYTKKEIIEIYTNSFYLGGGTYGVEKASQVYFGKSVKDLNLAEAALIAGLFQAPNDYDPLISPDRAEKRREQVLYLMELHGYITKEEKEIALQLKVPSLLKKTEEDNAIAKQYLAFINTVVKEVETRTKLNPYYTPMHIYSTMDRDKQEYVDKVMYTNDLFKWQNSKVDAGIVVLETGTGEIVAIGGGRNTVARGFNNATDTKNQIGSTSKPLFDYGPAIEYNHISTYNLIADEPYKYTGGGTLYNWNNTYDNIMTTREAIRDSRNVPALKTFQSVKLSNIKDFVTKLHLHPEEGLHEAHSIGGYNGESPLSLAGAYQAIASGGYYIEPHSVRKIVYLENGEEYNVVTPKEKAMSASTAYMLTDMLITTFRKSIGSINGATAASKTGTTDFSPATIRENNLSSSAVRDLWYAGFNKDYTLTVWYGYDRIYSDYYTKRGNTSHRDLFVIVGKKLFKGYNFMSKPSNVVKVEVEKESYPAKLPSEYTPKDYCTTELFIDGTQPTEVSTRFSQLANVTNLSGTYSNGKVTLAWSPIATPETLNEDYLRNMYNPLFTSSTQLEKYLEKRMKSEKELFGNMGYRIYIKHADGTLEGIDYTYDSTYTHTISNTNDSITYVVKSEFDVFSANASSGAEVTITFSNNDVIITSYLNGQSNVDIAIGSTYTEPNPPVYVQENLMSVTNLATISTEIKIAGTDTIVSSIDTSKEGNYVINYTIRYKNYENVLKRYVNVK